MSVCVFKFNVVLDDTQSFIGYLVKFFVAYRMIIYILDTLSYLYTTVCTLLYEKKVQNFTKMNFEKIKGCAGMI